MNVHPAETCASVEEPRGNLVLHLFGGPHVTIGDRRRAVPEGSKRLLVFVSLNGGVVERRYAASALWPDGDDVRAAGNLRSALWRLRQAGIEILTADKVVLRFRPSTTVDVDVLCGWAARLVGGTLRPGDLDRLPWESGLVELDLVADHLRAPDDLLPGWDFDGALFERERIRQRVLHGFEALAGHLIRARRHVEAVEMARISVAADPLRESAPRVLVQAQLANGDPAAAERSYRCYRALLHDELGIEPRSWFYDRPRRSASGQPTA